MKRLILKKIEGRKLLIRKKPAVNVSFTGVEKELFDILSKDSNSETASIMVQSKRVMDLYERLKKEKGKKFKSVMIWDLLDVCPWCKKTIRTKLYCPVCRF